MPYILKIGKLLVQKPLYIGGLISGLLIQLYKDKYPKGKQVKIKGMK